MIENLKYLVPDTKVMIGTFRSRIFKNGENDILHVFLPNDTIKDYAEKCVEHFNNMPDKMVDIICKAIIKSTTNDFSLLENSRDILKYCEFRQIRLHIPKNDEVVYTADGLRDDGDDVSFIVRGNKVLYVGYLCNYSPFESYDYYRNLDSNYIYYK